MSKITKIIKDETIYDSIINDCSGNVKLGSLLPYLKNIQKNFEKFDENDLKLINTHLRAMEGKVNNLKLSLTVLGFYFAMFGFIFRKMVEQAPLLAGSVFLIIGVLFILFIMTIYKRTTNILICKEIVELQLDSISKEKIKKETDKRTEDIKNFISSEIKQIK